MENNGRLNEIKKACEDITGNNEKVILNALKVISRVSDDEIELCTSAIETIEKLLSSTNSKVVSYSCWTLGQIGIKQPDLVANTVAKIKELLDSQDADIREKAVWALGRISRANTDFIKEFLPKFSKMAKDPEPRVRMNFIWACENVATTDPDLFKDYIPIFIELLSDNDTKYVRPEAPEIFRVIGAQRPEMVNCAIPILEQKLNDDCRVTCIHSNGALKAIRKSINNKKKQISNAQTA